MRWYHANPQLNIKGEHPLEFQMWISQIIPQDLTNKSVLDLAAWDGYYSVLATQRNAKKIVAIDNGISESLVFNQKPETLIKKYKIINKKLKTNIEFFLMDVEEIDKLPNFDIIFCFGIFYHVKNPYELFEKCYQKCNELLLLEGHIFNSVNPVAYFYASKELNNDPTNYWGMSPVCIIKMLKRIGFKDVKIIATKLSDRILIEAKK